MTLPIFAKKSDILQTLRERSPIVLQSPTGTGKSTQVPQFALDSGLCEGTILVLEPRRIAARMLAMRVASERGEAVGETIGYQTRFESAISGRTRVKFITEGILPRMMLSDPTLSSVSLVIFDEFHERSLSTDLGLALVKKLKQSTRPDLGVIVMSATLESDELRKYLHADKVIGMEEQLYPVTVDYLVPGARESIWDAAARAVGRICESGGGDILVFMPGAYEIRKTVRAIERNVRAEKLRVLPLYGNLSVEQQNAVMEPVEKRKVIVATNIAETSLTIPGIRHVIDGGLARIPRYDPSKGFDTLHVEQISLASMKQRTGRAGREAQGSCIRLWRRGDDKNRPRHTDPEIARVDMTETVLYLRMLGIDDPLRFDWLQHPPGAALHDAEKTCRELRLIDPTTGAITQEGSLLAGMPMHPRLAMILTHCARNGAPEWGAMAAALLSERPITTNKQALRNLTAGSDCRNDFVAMARLIEEAHKRGYDPTACGAVGVNGSSARQVLRTQQYFNEMIYLHPHVTISEPREPKHISLAKALALAYPDRLARRRDQGTLICEMRDGRVGELAQESTVRKAPLLIAADIRETKSGRTRRKQTLLSFACEVTREWLEELFPDRLHTEPVLVWDSRKQQVEARNQLRCMGLLIEESQAEITDTKAASRVLAESLLSRKMRLEGWDAANQFIGRIRKASKQHPQAGLPAFDEKQRREIVHRLCEGHTSYGEVKAKAILPFVEEMLSDEQREMVEESRE